MNKYKIKFSEIAKSDLISIIKYIKYDLQEPNIARKLNKKIKDNIYKLSENPKLYSLIDDEVIKKLQLRKIIIDNYLIFYRIMENDNSVQIVRVMYGRRNWINLL